MSAASAATISADEARSLLAGATGRGRILVAVSGGPDSVALMRLCAAVLPEAATGHVCAATVDHGLRAASRAEAEAVGAWARACGLDHAVLAWEGQKPATGLQEKARAARYRLLAAHAHEIGAATLLTAHTLDDQAETVLMRLARGSGLAGLAGMRAASRRMGLTHLRPLLGVAKVRLVATCAANRWDHVADPSNLDPRFERARWRALAPTLARAGLTAPRLARLAERLALAEDALDEKAKIALAAARIASGPRGLLVDIAALQAREPREIVLRALLRALAEAGGRDGPATPVRLDRAEAALSAIEAGIAARRRLTRSLAGTILAFDGERHLSLRREGPRRRGRAARAMSEAPAGQRDDQSNANAWLSLA